jgi:ribosomal protein S12 methylthiotransferase accessory factor
MEACIHGLCEVIERDCMALWYLHTAEEKSRKSLDLSSIDDERCHMLIDMYMSSDVAVGVWDITSDIGIPAFICKIVQKDAQTGNRVRPAMGSGCHVDKNVALSRALTEAAQSRLTFISGARDDQSHGTYTQHQSDETFFAWHAELSAFRGQKNFVQIDKYNGDFLQDDYEWILQALQRVGIRQAVCVNLTRSEFNIPVVKIIIPGLESPLDSDRVGGDRLMNFMGRHGKYDG